MIHLHFCFSSDYDTYASYRNDPYLAASGQPPQLRHGLASAYQQPPPPQTGYPPTNPQRQQSYTTAPGASTSTYPPPVAPYYGAQQRA